MMSYRFATAAVYGPAREIEIGPAIVAIAGPT